MTIADAVASFLSAKLGEGLKKETLSHHRLTLDRLSEFCRRENISQVEAITLLHLVRWRSEWPFRSKLAARVHQQRVRTFFKFLKDAALIAENPAKKLSPVRVHDRVATQPFTVAEMDAILVAAPLCSCFSAEVAARVHSLMLLQRWAGLAIQDAVMLPRRALIPTTLGSFRIVTRRVKTGVEVNNLIPAWVGWELEKLPSRSPGYFFWTGKGTGKSAASIYMKRYAKVFEKAGIQGGHSHRFRDTAACELLARGVDIRKVSKFLGHTSVTITERYYAPWMAAEQEALDREVERVWSSQPACA